MKLLKDRVIGINLWGVIHGCHFFLDALRKADAAHIVNLSSMTGFVGLPMQSSYCATKAAVKGLSESLWAELAAAKIVAAVRRGKLRIRVGKDAVLLDLLKRWFPVAIHKPMRRIIGASAH